MDRCRCRCHGSGYDGCVRCLGSVNRYAVAECPGVEKPRPPRVRWKIFGPLAAYSILFAGMATDVAVRAGDPHVFWQFPLFFVAVVAVIGGGFGRVD